jgi:disulfide bond formation protein DsbB
VTRCRSRSSAPLAAWHTVLFFGLVLQAIEPYGAGSSCGGSNTIVLGWLPLSLLSLAAFAAIYLLLVATGRKEQR